MVPVEQLNKVRRSIKHVFVLMLENRSFDHMLGYSAIQGKLATDRTRQVTINGIDPTRPPVNKDTNGETVPTSADAPFVIDKTDPGHEFPDVYLQLTGNKFNALPTGGVYPDNLNNQGFVEDYDIQPKPPTDPHVVMKCFDPLNVPVINALAKEFVVCDNWYSSLPGPTWPNRFFVHAATSGGLDCSPSAISTAEADAFNNLDGFSFSNGSIYDLLTKNNIKWKIYAGNYFPQVRAIKGIKCDDVEGYEHFSEDINSGNYDAAYTFIEPNYGDFIAGNFKGGNSQHPMDDVTGGEKLIKETYEAIRKSSLWENSLFIVTYDEHGGFFDHVTPPAGAPAPGDNTKYSRYGFNFEQYGVRVPAIIVSPLIEQNLVDKRIFDHGSLLATVEEIFGIPALTGRDKNATTFTDLMSLDAARNTPLTLPDAADSKQPAYVALEEPNEEEGIDPALAGFVQVATLQHLELTDPSQHEAIKARVRTIHRRKEALQYMQEVQVVVAQRRKNKRNNKPLKPTPMATPQFTSWLDRLKQKVETSFHEIETWEAAFLGTLESDLPHIFNLRGKHLYDLMIKDPEVKAHFDSLSGDQKRLLNDAIYSDPSTSSSRGKAYKEELRQQIVSEMRQHPDVKEADGSGVNYVTQIFENWGRTVHNQPFYTFLPRTKVGVQNVVKWSKEQERRVRVSGYRHTWGDMFSKTGEVLISFLPLNVVEELPSKEPCIDPNNEMQGISIVGAIHEGGVTKGLCKIGTGTTNEQFRRWCVHPMFGNRQWTLPLNVIMVEITLGGSNAPICHGAGLNNKTLSDLVTEIEFVNAKGVLQTVKDPEQLKAAAGCFGLLGVVTSITLKLDPMSYAVMQPVKVPLGKTIPPPAGINLPATLQADMAGITQAEKDAAWADFISRCKNDYYTEWFWFPNQKNCWINTWKNNGLKQDSIDHPTPLEAWVEEMEEYMAGLVNDTVFKLLPGKAQANFVGGLAMLFLPSNKTITVPLIDALHFRRGIQNMRVLDMEFEIPIPKLPSGEPDWSVCQQAWWQVLCDFYERDNSPLRTTLELRVMADSDVAMAPQYGNRYGTCSIEILTTLQTDAVEWQQYMQDIVDKWSSIKDQTTGAKLNLRPHWAKMWQGINMGGKEIVTYLKEEAYKDQLPIFKNSMELVATAGGYSLKDCQALFSNPLLDNIFETVFEATGPAAQVVTAAGGV